jgi:L-threonylcarbamoyladenylate synthase
LKDTPTPVSEFPPSLYVTLSQAQQALQQGQLVAFPTETVYGLGASLAHPEAIEAIFTLKGRPTGHPLIVHVATVGQAQALAATWPPVAQALAQAFWPGPLTLILPKASHVPASVTGGKATVGLRIPSHPVALALLGAMNGVGVAAPSANRFKGLSPTTAAHVRAAFSPEQLPHVLEGGSATVGLESTIVDCATHPDALVLLRPGAIVAQQLTHATGLPVRYTPSSCGEAAGMLATHYQGEKPLRLFFSEQLHATVVASAHALAVAQGGVVVLASGPPPATLSPYLRWEACLPPLDDVAAYAQGLYAWLHWADTLPQAQVWLETPELTPDTLACWDRLSRMLGRPTLLQSLST